MKDLKQKDYLIVCIHIKIIPSSLQMKQTKFPFSTHVELRGYCNLPSIILAGAELEPSAVLLCNRERL